METYHELPAEGATIVVGLIVGAVTLSGFIANLSIIVSFKIDKKLQKSRHIYTINGAVCDVILCLLIVPVTCSFVFVDQWPVRGLCEAWLCLTSAVLLASHFSFLLLSRDRCMMASQHVDAYHDVEAKKIVFRNIAVMWLIAIAIYTPFIPTWKYIDPSSVSKKSSEMCYPGFLFNPAFVFITASLEAITVGSVLLHFTRKMYFNIRERQRAFDESNISEDADQWLTKDRKMAKALLTATVFFIVLWLPLLVSVLVQSVCGDCVKPVVFLFLMGVYTIRCTVTPLCLGWEDQRLQLNMKKLLCFWKQNEIAPLLQVTDS